MDGTDRVRQANAAVSAGQDHSGESQNELHQRSRGRFADAARPWTAWSYCRAAAGGQDDSAQGNRESDSDKSSRHRPHRAFSGRAAGRSDRF